ncbi:MAG TPA: type II toxin-antitoxin system RelE/ParE family toxin [Patescibacteria group bacterium]|nr:type II toxin-antitoxin system RelE/ParE family toxin [Patescibacteria group bacterium]
MRVRWSRPALSDIARIYDYVAQFNPAAAARLAVRLDEAAGELELFPHRGRPTGRPGRRQLTIVPPYVLTYEVRADLVEVLGVRHGAQRSANGDDLR